MFRKLLGIMVAELVVGHCFEGIVVRGYKGMKENGYQNRLDSYGSY